MHSLTSTKNVIMQMKDFLIEEKQRLFLSMYELY